LHDSEEGKALCKFAVDCIDAVERRIRQTEDEKAMMKLSGQLHAWCVLRGILRDDHSAEIEKLRQSQRDALDVGRTTPA